MYQLGWFILVGADRSLLLSVFSPTGPARQDGGLTRAATGVGDEPSRRESGASPGMKTEVEKESGGPSLSSSRGLRKRTRELERSEQSSGASRGGKRKKFQCSRENCNKTYVSASSLRRHQHDHHGPKEVCNNCGRDYNKSGLQRHQEICKKISVRAVGKVDDEDLESGDEEDEMMGSKLLEMII